MNRMFQPPAGTYRGTEGNTTKSNRDNWILALIAVLAVATSVAWGYFHGVDKGVSLFLLWVVYAPIGFMYTLMFVGGLKGLRTYLVWNTLALFRRRHNAWLLKEWQFGHPHVINGVQSVPPFVATAIFVIELVAYTFFARFIPGNPNIAFTLISVSGTYWVYETGRRIFSK